MDLDFIEHSTIGLFGSFSICIHLSRFETRWNILARNDGKHTTSEVEPATGQTRVAISLLLIVPQKSWLA